MRIKDFPTVNDSHIFQDCFFIVDGNDGTKSVKAEDLVTYFRHTDLSKDFFKIIDSQLPQINKRCIWRGKNLGDHVTDDHYAQIANGTFKGLFLGDYWVIDERVWRIVDFDYWLNTGTPECTDHHLVIMPDISLYSSQMNEADTTQGGYVGSKMYTDNLQTAKEVIYEAFGTGHILSHNTPLSNSVISGTGIVGGIIFVDSDIELPNEIMIYGGYIYTLTGGGTIIPTITTIDNTQLAAFKVNRNLMFMKRENFWLRDVVSASDFVFVTYRYGMANNPASRSYGVRPVFAIKGVD